MKKKKNEPLKITILDGKLPDGLKLRNGKIQGNKKKQTKISFQK